MNLAPEEDRPNLVVMAILFVAACLIGAILGMILFSVLTDQLGWRPLPALAATSLAMILGLAGYAIHMVRHPWCDSRPDSPHLFHVYQVAVVGTCFGVAFLMGQDSVPEFKWLGLVFDIIVALFYLAYIGFSFALHRAPGKSMYAGITCVALCIWYGVRAAAR